MTKTIIYTLAAIGILLTTSAYQNYDDKKVNLRELADKDFKFIFKFDSKTSIQEFHEAETFLKQYDPSVKLTVSTNKLNSSKSLTIKASRVKCSSDNYRYGMIVIDKNNVCNCAMGEKIK